MPVIIAFELASAIFLIVYALYLFYRNADLPEVLEDGGPSPYQDALGQRNLIAFQRWLFDGMPNVGSGIKNTFSNMGIRPPWWILLVIALFVILTIKEKIK
jgi:hypothetical protein